MGQYDAIKMSATRMLTLRGAVLQVRRNGEITRVNGVEQQMPDTFFDVVGVASKYSLREVGGVVQRGDVKFFASAQKEIMTGDIIKITGLDYEVKDPGPVNPDGSGSLIYICQLRLA